MKERETKKERKTERKRERERGRENCPEMLFLFSKGMTGALAPFNYLLLNIVRYLSVLMTSQP